jgi:predicted transcriptional regulator
MSMANPIHDATRQPPVYEQALTPEQDAALARSISRGEAQFQAGEGIDGEAVFTWMRSWGTENELPAPKRTTRRP